VFWSVNSVGSDNVRHEATVAKQHGKLVPVMLDPLTAEQFPMGLYAVQGANLSAWIGDLADSEWVKLQREVEARLTPMWTRRMMDGLEAELLAERARREAAERRDKTLRDQIAKEAQAQQDLRHERDRGLEELSALRSQLDRMKPSAGDAPDGQIAQRLKDTEAQRDMYAGQAAAAARRIAVLERRIGELERSQGGPPTPQEDIHRPHNGAAKASPAISSASGRTVATEESRSGAASIPPGLWLVLSMVGIGIFGLIALSVR
jgi:hypothetical protein